MSEFLTGVRNWFTSIGRQFGMIGLNDIVDILIVAVLIFYAYKFIQDRRAGKLAGGLVLLILVQAVAKLLGLKTMSYLLSNIFQVGLIAVLIIFQPELRAVLEKVGGESLRGISGIKQKGNIHQVDAAAESLCKAVYDMSDSKTGALIVLENTTRLGDIVKTGEVVNADLTPSLVKNIFFNKAPLHDGAMVVRDLKILAAGCFLPLTDSQELPKELGTRHRAALGMSEASDAMVIVVSEETGTVAVAMNGKLKRPVIRDELKKEIIAFYTPKVPEFETGEKRKHPAKRKKKDDLTGDETK